MRRVFIALTIAAGCGDDGPGQTIPGDVGTGSDAPPGTCARQPPAADRTRYVVIAHPYTAASMASNEWEVLELSPAGVLSRPGRTFTMGRAFVGEVTFTLDGKIGAVAQDDGSVGVFRLDNEGVPTVIHAQLQGDFYADRVVTAPDGTLYVLDNQWRENGGGIYRLAIDCDDNVSDGGLVIASKLPAGLQFLPNSFSTQKAVVAANDIAESPAGHEGHVLDWGYAEPTHESSTDLFPEDEAIIGGTAIGFTNPLFFVGDTSGFSSVPNSVAIANLSGEEFGGPVERVEVEDPITILPDPDRDQVLVVSGFGNAMFVLDKPGSMWRTTEVTYMGAPPQLPGGAVMIGVGSLRGHVLVGENLGVRQARFTASGVEDLGMFSLGAGIENSTGAIGVTP